MSEVIERFENNICMGGVYHDKEFRYNGESDYISYTDGYYLKTNQVNEDDLVIWIWKPAKTK